MSDAQAEADMEAASEAWLANREHYYIVGYQPSPHMLFMDAFRAGLDSAREN